MPTKKKVYNKSTGRKYGPGSYDSRYLKKTVKDRVKRNAARAIVKKSLTKKYGKKKAASMLKGKEIDHIKSLKKKGSNIRSNLRISSISKNRSRK